MTARLAAWHGWRTVKHALEWVYAHSPDWFQSVMLNRYARQIRLERFTPEYQRWMRVFAENEHRSTAELALMQDRSLRDLIAYAHEKVPYYRDAMKQRGLSPGDIRGATDLPKLPILTRDLLRSQIARLTSSDYAPKQLKQGSTSGTTGSPTSVLWDRRVEVANHACNWRARRWAGFEYGAHYASLLGRTVVPLTRQRPPYWRWNREWKQLLLSSFHLHEQKLPLYLEAMKAHGVRFLEAYPSTGYVLARFLVESGGRFPLEAVVVSSETLLPVQREAMERAFACRVWDVYSQAERVMFAMECERHDGLHLQPEFGVLEVVDELGAPVAPGRPGRMIATGLENYGMPLIRYEVGDVTAITPEPCACGRTLPRMAAITTKAEDIVVTPEGRFISSSTLTHPFKPMVRIEQSQIVQERPDRVTVKIVRRPGYGDEDTRQLITALGHRLGPSVKIVVEFVDDIPRGANGKFRWVVSKVPLKFGESQQSNLYEQDEAKPK